MEWYNGFSPEERLRMLRETQRKAAAGELAPLQGPCGMCGETEGGFQYHSEDYREPYSWDPPATNVLCKPCHSRLHKRFGDPLAWEAFKRHVRRGGLSSEVKTPECRKELAAVKEAIAQGVPPPELPVLRPREIPADAWWEHVSMDPRVAPEWLKRPR